MEKQVYSRNKQALHYRIIGQGPLILLLHGFGMDGRIWDGLLPELSKAHLCLVPDIPGSGQSDMPAEWTIDHLAEDMMGLVQQVGNGKPFVVIGHSMGGYIGLSMVNKYPDKIKALTLFHSTTYADDTAKKEARGKSIQFIRQHGAEPFIKQFIPNLFAAGNRKKNKAEINLLISRYTNFSPDALVGYYEAMMDRKDRTDLLKKSGIWFQFIIGAEDPAVSPAHALEQSALPEKASIHYLETVGHMGMIEAPEEITGILVKFLQTIEIENQ